MTSRRFISAALGIAAVLMIAPRAESTPPRISDLSDATRLSERDRDEIRESVEYWCARLGSAQADEVDAAQSKLVEPLKAVRVGQIFRLEYSKALVPRLKEVIKGADPHAAVNGMQIAGLLGTPNALEIITDHAGIEDEQRFAIRLWAANAFPLAVRQRVLPENDINKALRRFGQAATQEDNWLVLRRQFEAVASVNNRVSRDVQVNVLKAIADRMEKETGPSELMQATYPALVLLRNRFLELRAADQESVGTELAPVLCDLCTVANMHWDSAQADADASSSYRGTVRVSENLLKLIDARVRPRQSGPRTELGPAWIDRDKDRFEADHDKWRQVLTGPPYNKR